MENPNDPLDSSLEAGRPEETLQITPDIRSYWHESSKWSLFFAILGFVYLGIIGILMLASSQGGFGAAGAIVTLLIIGAIVFFPCWYMFKFARLLKQGIDDDSTRQAEESFSNLRRFYQFIGILTIVFLSFYAIVLLFSLGMMFTGFGR